MLEALRRIGKSLPLAVLSAASLAAGAQSVTIAPGYTNLGVNQTLQYTATVTGLTNTAVTWEVNGVKSGNSTIGTITSNGLYKAPAKIPTVSTLVEALGSDHKTLGAVYVNLEPAGPTLISASPNPIPTGNFSVTLTGTGFKPGVVVSFNGGNQSATYINSTTIKTGGYWYTATPGTFQAVNPGALWSNTLTVPFKNSVQVPPQTIAPTTVSVILGQSQQFTSSGATSFTASAGTITAAGLFTAPAVMPSSATATIAAIGPGGTATATVTLQPIPPQFIAPNTASLDLGAQLQFSSSGATSFTATAGTMSAAGLYTAPLTEPTSGTATITAKGPGGSATAVVTIINSLPTTISPTSSTVTLDLTQQFTSNGSTWSALYGTISATGLYTAPAAMPASGKDTVSVSGLGGSASATVALVPPAPVITAAGTGGQLPLGIFSATVTGTGFINTSVVSINGSALTTTYSSPISLTISGFVGQAGPGSLVVSNGSVVSAPFAVQVGVPNPQVSPAAARRFLEQAAFGPTPTDAATVQNLGFQQWIANQFAMPQVSNYNVITGDQGGMPTHFLTNAVNNPDQLRQRTAFALSQIFVTSLEKLIWNGNMVSYQNTLLNDSFSNYRQIMEDVTLSPAMGQYLDMGNNAKADPTTGAVANENYARELMQLFTIGTVMLNQDGSPQTDSSGIPIPTYSQFTVTEFARVYTGWTYAPPAGQPIEWDAYYSAGNMVPYPAEHDSGSKQLLNGAVNPAGLTPQQDLDAALDNIFNHPNVGPFVGRMLIQHLVKSNPSHAYISRVAAAFNNDGTGVRGNMQVVLAAILLDPEARANDQSGEDQPTDGHLQEPALFMAGMVRAFGGQMNDQNYYATELANMGQDVFQSPSVFNYYAPDYGVPGATAASGAALMGGEFQVYSPNNAIIRANEVSNLFANWGSSVETYGPGTTVDITPFLPLASNPTTLVNALNLTLTHGTMPAAMKSAIVTAVTANTSGNLRQVQQACYLILTSNYYNVWH
jgi:uncharacterized protein (DUF1800 family)